MGMDSMVSLDTIAIKKAKARNYCGLKTVETTQQIKFPSKHGLITYQILSEMECSLLSNQKREEKGYLRNAAAEKRQESGGGEERVFHSVLLLCVGDIQGSVI